MSKPQTTNWVTEEQDAISRFLFGDDDKNTVGYAAGKYLTIIGTSVLTVTVLRSYHEVLFQ